MVSHGGDVNYKVGEDLFLTAGDNTYNSNTKSSTATAGFWVGTNGLKDSGGLNITGVSGNVGGGKSKSSTNDLTWTSGYTQAEQGTIRFDVGNDMKAEGYTAIGKHIDVNVGGDLDLISKQNSHTSSGSSWNASGGLGIGLEDGKAKELQSVSGGFGKGRSSENRLWTDDVSGLIGSESVNVDVGGKLNLEGSVIANIKEDGTDGGNLKVAANELTFKDLDDYSKSSENYLGVSTVRGNPLNENKDHPEGTTTITAVDKGYELTGVTRATIGQGEITLRDGTDVASIGINRDIDNIQEITGDKVTGALDFEVTVDNRIFTPGGWASIGEDFTNLPQNIQTLAMVASSLPKESFTKIMISTGLNQEQAEGIWNDIQTHSGDIVINPFDYIKDNPDVLTRVEDLTNSSSFVRIMGLAQLVGGTIVYIEAAATGNFPAFATGFDQAHAGAYAATWGEYKNTKGGEIISNTTGISIDKAEMIYGFMTFGASVAGLPKSAGSPAGSSVLKPNVVTSNIDDVAKNATVTVYRVEGAPNTRILIGEQGQVALQGDDTMLFLNFGNKARAEEFLTQRLGQNMEGATIKSFEVPKPYLDKVRKDAVQEVFAKFPGNSVKPIRVDTSKAPDQYGLRPSQLDELKGNIIQGTGKNGK